MKIFTMNIDNTIERIFSCYEKFGDEIYFGEKVTQLQHAFQAADFARANNATDEVVLAAFFHDIGHLCVDATENNAMDNLGIKEHELVGAQFLLNCGFSETVYKLVAAHVPAKRYLAYKYPEYKNKLSEASLKTLEHQGGIFNDKEALRFESDELHPLYIKMRLWDEGAKDEKTPIGDLEEIKNLTKKYLLSIKH